MLPPMIPVESKWVHSIGYIPAFSRSAGVEPAARGRLYVRFKDKKGNITVTVCYKPDIPPAMWESLKAASSKGVWVHENVIHMDYDLL